MCWTTPNPCFDAFNAFHAFDTQTIAASACCTYASGRFGGLRMRYGDGAKRYIPCLFRFAMQCPRCNHHHTQKIGLSRHKRQRWMCMGCRRTFGDKDLRLIDPKIKALALAMYAEGIAARKIERLLHVSHNAVLGWVRKEVAGKALQAAHVKDLAVIEADEMWSYVGSKNSPSGCGGQ